MYVSGDYNVLLISVFDSSYYKKKTSVELTDLDQLSFDALHVAYLTLCEHRDRGVLSSSQYHPQ